MVGTLFSNRAKSITSTEIVVLITPTIIDFTLHETGPEFEFDPIRRVEIINHIMDAEMADTTQEMETAFGGAKQFSPTDVNDRK